MDSEKLKQKVEYRQISEAKYIADLIIGKVALPLFPLYWITDILFYPAFKWEFLGYRILCSLLALWCLREARSSVTLFRVQVICTVYSGILANVLLLMVIRTGDLTSIFLFGINTVGAGMLGFVPITGLFLWVAPLAIYLPMTVYLAVIAYRYPVVPFVVYNLFFIASIIAMAYLVGHFGERRRKQETEALSEVENIKLSNDALETRAALIQVSKMASIGEMATSIIHELGGPLTILQGITYKLTQTEENSTLSSEQIIKLGKMGQRTIQRMNATILGLKAFAYGHANEASKLIPIPLLISDALEICAHKTRHKRTDIKINVPNHNLELECRNVQVVQVLVNLIGNALDAIENLQERWVQIDVVDNEHQIMISITDSGPGIPKELREKIMESFFTTKPKGKGTGLGLSISRRIVEDHGGDFYYDEKSPRTRFVVLLPKKFEPVISKAS